MTTSDTDPAPASTARPRRFPRARLILGAVQVRLRFVVVLALAFLVVGRWDVLRNRWDQLARAARGGGTGSGTAAVSTDTEYFCPMDPGVLSDWPGKCGVCNMPLVRRKKGDATPLPSGVVARMQFSPYRLQLAGVRTAAVEYRPLAREVVLSGEVSDEGASRGVLARVSGRDLPLLAVGLPAEVEVDGVADPRARPLGAKVVAVGMTRPGSDARVALEFEPDNAAGLHAGQVVTAHVRRAMAEVEPFRSMPADAPPLRPGEPRSVYLCAEHAEVLADAPGRCPVDGRATLEAQPLAAGQRVGWWCPMHPKVVADRPGATCRECGGMRLVPRVITYRPAGQVLAVPESAVVDTGSRTVVYVERMPGMFDGVEVTLGPRCGTAYPVAAGLEPGQRVATSGAFLIDAETRLNPALASAYFGATRADRGTAAPPVPTPAPVPAVDLKVLAAAQKVCPVTGKPLGSMGTPVAVMVTGRTVLVCCEGCRGPLTGDPQKYLARLKSGTPSGTAGSATPP